MLIKLLDRILKCSFNCFILRVNSRTRPDVVCERIENSRKRGRVLDVREPRRPVIRSHVLSHTKEVTRTDLLILLLIQLLNLADVSAPAFDKYTSKVVQKRPDFLILE